MRSLPHKAFWQQLKRNSKASLRTELTHVATEEEEDGGYGRVAIKQVDRTHREALQRVEELEGRTEHEIAENFEAIVPARRRCSRKDAASSSRAPQPPKCAFSA